MSLPLQKQFSVLWPQHIFYKQDSIPTVRRFSSHDVRSQLILSVEIILITFAKSQPRVRFFYPCLVECTEVIL